MSKSKYRFVSAKPKPNIGVCGVKDIDALPLNVPTPKVRRKTYVEKFAKARERGIYSLTALNQTHTRFRTSMATSLGEDGELDMSTMILVDEVTGVMAKQDLMMRYMKHMLDRHKLDNEKAKKLGERARGGELWDLTAEELERFWETSDRHKALGYAKVNLMSKLLMTPMAKAKYKEKVAKIADLTTALQERQQILEGKPIDGEVVVEE